MVDLSLTAAKFLGRLFLRDAGTLSHRLQIVADEEPESLWIDDARDKLTRHLYAKAYPDPAMTQLNR